MTDSKQMPLFGVDEETGEMFPQQEQAAATSTQTESGSTGAEEQAAPEGAAAADTQSGEAVLQAAAHQEEPAGQEKPEDAAPAQTQENAESDPEPEDGKTGKKKRTRSTKEQMAEKQAAEWQKIKEKVIEELKAEGVIPGDEAEREADRQSDNLGLYNRVRAVPDYARKKIEDGPLKGLDDINPQHRIKVLTREFGPCGEGWKTQVVSQEIINVPMNNYGASMTVPMASVHIRLYYRLPDRQWSAPIEGFGGCPFINRKTQGLDDDAFKKATTDALSVCCKQLGIGADVYFNADADFETKYTGGQGAQQQPLKPVYTPQEKPAEQNAPQTETASPAPRQEAPAAGPETAPQAAPQKEKDAPQQETPAAGRPGVSRLAEGSPQWFRIMTSLCSLVDRSPENLMKLRGQYSQNLDIDDDTWRSLLENAGI